MRLRNEERVMAKTELVRKLDAAIAGKNLLKHPFDQGWQAGKLSREALQLYATQYYKHVSAFPGRLHVLAAGSEGSLPKLVDTNRAEAVDAAAPHPNEGSAVSAGVDFSE